MGGKDVAPSPALRQGNGQLRLAGVAWSRKLVPKGGVLVQRSAARSTGGVSGRKHPLALTKLALSLLVLGCPLLSVANAQLALPLLD